MTRLIVFLIVAFATMIIGPNINRRFSCPRHARVARTDLVGIGSALEEYAQGHGRYPPSLHELLEPDESGERFLDCARLPLDPWGAEYVYVAVPDGTGFWLYTFGEDGALGGVGESGDISYDEVLQRHRGRMEKRRQEDMHQRKERRSGGRRDQRPHRAAQPAFDFEARALGFDHSAPLPVDRSQRRQTE